MNRTLCYLNPLKSNNLVMLEAFAQGSGAEITQSLELVAGRAAVLYGVDKKTLPLWREIERTQHPYFYIDNGYFRSKWHGGDYFRITANAPQCSGSGKSTGERWNALGLSLQPWRSTGSHILIACQSDFWHERHGHGSAAEFAEKITRELRRYTERKVIVRAKPNKVNKEQPLQDALRDCWAVVTHSSMVALEGILAGVPAFALASSALSPMASADLSKIEDPLLPADRLLWASVLSDSQWTMEEIRNGTAWRMQAQ